MGMHFSQLPNREKKINLVVRDGCVGRTAAAWLSETSSFDAKKQLGVVNVMAAHELKNTR